MRISKHMISENISSAGIVWVLCMLIRMHRWELKEEACRVYGSSDRPRKFPDHSGKASLSMRYAD
jgi:hypothetical protein